MARRENPHRRDTLPCGRCRSKKVSHGIISGRANGKFKKLSAIGARARRSKYAKLNRMRASEKRDDGRTGPWREAICVFLCGRCLPAAQKELGGEWGPMWLLPKATRKRKTRTRKTLICFYHATTMEAAASILREGFRDGIGHYLTDTEWTGVWLSDRPLDENEGAHGHTLLKVRIDATLVEPYEWKEEHKTHREFLVPAAVLNAHAHVRRA